MFFYTYLLFIYPFGNSTDFKRTLHAGDLSRLFEDPWTSTRIICANIRGKIFTFRIIDWVFGHFKLAINFLLKIRK